MEACTHDKIFLPSKNQAGWRLVLFDKLDLDLSWGSMELAVLWWFGKGYHTALLPLSVRYGFAGHLS